MGSEPYLDWYAIERISLRYVPFSLSANATVPRADARSHLTISSSDRTQLSMAHDRSTRSLSS